MLEKAKIKILYGGLFNLLVIGIILFSIGISYSSDIIEINRAIEAQGARWFAKETPLSHLTLEEMKKWTGALEPETPEGGLPGAESFFVPVLPLSSSFDWTNHNGSNYVTGVRNQGGCGSCWAFATVAALESKALITFNTPEYDLNLSEQIVMSCSGGGNCKDGGYANTAADFLKNTGTNVESCYRYTAADGDCGKACTNWQNDTYKIDGWSYVNNAGTADATAIKNAVSQGPVVVWMKVFQDFQSYGSGVYTHTTGNYVGAHFVLIVGYNDDAGGAGAFRIKNSWGADWGEAGFGWIAYSELYGTGGSSEFGKWVLAFGNAVHTGTVPGQKPDLKPYQPDDWSDKIVVSKITGTNTDDSPLYSTDTLYVDFAAINDSDEAINTTFSMALYVDGVWKNSWSWNTLSAHHYGYVTDYSIGSLSAGTHTVKIVVDSTEAIAETNEGNNEHTRTITVQDPSIQKYCIGFDVNVSGKLIEDGYTSTNFSAGGLYLDICSTPSGDTTDYFEGYLYDDFGDYWQVYGTIVWNIKYTSGYIQGTNLDVTAPYIDGTIKYSYSSGKYSISAKGGNSDGASFMEIYSSIKGSGYEFLLGQGQATNPRMNRSYKFKGFNKIADSKGAMAKREDGGNAYGKVMTNRGQTTQIYCIGFDVNVSGKLIEDGYTSTNFSAGALYLDICSTPSGYTTDYFEGYLYDEFNDYWQVYGTIVWSKLFTSGYIQGTNLDVTAPYIDGTIKYSRGKYTLTAKGGNSDGFSFIEQYNSIKGSGWELASDAGKGGDRPRNSIGRIQSPDKGKSSRVFK